MTKQTRGSQGRDAGKDAHQADDRSGRKTTLAEGSQVEAYRRIVLATHNLVTNSYSVTLMIDGHRALVLPAEDWSAAQDEALRLIMSSAGADDEDSASHISQN